MDTNSMELREPYFNQDFAYSTNYLDYEIPDFLGIIEAAVPVLVVPEPPLLDLFGNCNLCLQVFCQMARTGRKNVE